MIEGSCSTSTRKYGKLTSLMTKQKINKDFNFKAVLEKNGNMELFLDGQLVDSTNIGESLPIPPDDPTSIGVDFRRLIGEYKAENYFKGWIGDLKFIVN